MLKGEKGGGVDRLEKLSCKFGKRKGDDEICVQWNYRHSEPGTHSRGSTCCTTRLQLQNPWKKIAHPAWGDDKG